MLTVEAERYQAEDTLGGARLLAIEPTPEEVLAHAATLSAAYNEPHNRAMMGNTTALSQVEVAEHFASLAKGGARSFLLFQDGALAGDADLRRIAAGSAELAILIAARTAQGRGLGTAFARMLHAFAFRVLELERIYVSILPDNTASLRLFEKLGYLRDDSARARAYADDATDVCLSLARADFDHAASEGVILSRR